MIYDSDTNSQISESQTHKSPHHSGYGNKLSAIWDNIQKTKYIQVSDNEDQETYEMYKQKKMQEKRHSQSKQPNQIQKKILTNLKAKRQQEVKTQQKRVHLKQRPDLSSQQNQRQHASHIKLKKHNQLQQKLQKSKQNTNILMKKLIEAEQQIQYLEYELQKQMSEKQQLLIELKTKNYEFETQQKQNRVLNSNRADKSTIESQITIDKYRLRLKAAEKEIAQKDIQLAQLEKDIKTLSAQMSQYQLKNTQHTQKVNYKGSELLQLNEAYKTIQRLINLLKSTEQYRLLGNFAQQVKKIHFLSKIPKQIKTQISNIKISSKAKDKQAACQHCTEVKINQRLLWTPMLCYKKMLQMKIKHDTLNEDCIEEVLFEMNKLYLSKEETRVNKLKTFYESEIDKLKKKTQLTYDQVLAKKQIQRLKKQIQTSKKKPTSKSSYKKPSDPNVEQKLKKFPNNTSNIQNLKVIGQYEDQLRLKEKQVKLLMERIKLLQGETTSYDKSLYMEGVLWIIDKILEELDTNGEDIMEFEDKFRAKMSSAVSTDDWIRLFKEFFQSVEELNHSLIEKILTIKETTINKMNYAKLS